MSLLKIIFQRKLVKIHESTNMTDRQQDRYDSVDTMDLFIKSTEKNEAGIVPIK